jgi:hypothetical protein
MHNSQVFTTAGAHIVSSCIMVQGKLQPRQSTDHAHFARGNACSNVPSQQGSTAHACPKGTIAQCGCSICRHMHMRSTSKHAAAHTCRPAPRDLASLLLPTAQGTCTAWPPAAACHAHRAGPPQCCSRANAARHAAPAHGCQQQWCTWKHITTQKADISTCMTIAEPESHGTYYCLKNT